ncbi:Vomeronasal type-2 receptor 1 [Vulpes lagopus]
MYNLETLKFAAHNGEGIEIDENGDVTGHYDILNRQVGDNAEIAFVKVGECILTNSKFELMMKKNATIFWKTESAKPEMAT